MSIGHRSAHSTDSSSSVPPSPTPKSFSPSPRAIKITAAFERVHGFSTSLQIDLLNSSPEVLLTIGKRVKEFQGAVTVLFDELRHLPDDVPSTPALISAIQECSFEVHCFGSSAQILRAGFGCEGGEERQKGLVVMLTEATASMSMLLELVAQAIEDGETERTRLREELADLDTTKAERGLGSGLGSSIVDRPLSWLVPVGVDNHFAPLVSYSINPTCYCQYSRNQRNSNPAPLLRL